MNEPPTGVTVESPVESQFQLVEGADEMLDMPLGTLIFRAGLIAPQQLEDALAEGLRSGKRLGEVLLSRGWLSEEDLSRLLAGQKGLPYADLEKIAVDRELAQAMSYEDARSEMALPIVTEFGLPVIAMADPDETAMDRLRAQLGPEIRFVVGAPSVLARLIDEVLGGVSAPGLAVAPVTAEQFAPEEPAPAEQFEPGAPAPAEPIADERYQAYETPAESIPVDATAEPGPAPLEAAELDSGDQEAPAAAPDLAAQEILPIIAEGEVDYPTFSEYQPIPETEIIRSPDEQLPSEVQMGDFGYYDDPSLLEGNAWQVDELGPATEGPAAEVVDQAGAGQAAEELEQAEPEVATPIEDAEQPVEEDAASAEQAWEETSPELVSEPIEQTAPEQPLEPPEEGDAAAASVEEDQTASTPAWMQGEVNVITADVADFIDSGAEPPSSPDSPAVEYDSVAEAEPEPTSSEEEPPLEVEQALEAEEVFEQPAPPALSHIEPAAAELGAESPSWASEPVEAAEEAVTEAPGIVSSEQADADLEAPEPDSGGGQFELVLRLVDGDRIPIGSFDAIEKAQDKAAEVVKQFADIEEGRWPFIGGRFLRPETIVSIDVEQHDSGWGGSNSRGRMFSGG
ncbi:MAG: GspE/PulE/PilB domain-containing protein [Gaiellaceae bacterium]